MLRPEAKQAARPAGGYDGLLPAVLIVYTIMSLVFYGNPRIGVFCVPVCAVYAAGLLAKIAEPFRGQNPHTQSGEPS